ncbi:reverse transcriptase domain-containing protein, partial [Tanacetum coccineum]
VESHKSSTEHPIVNEFVIINIPEEDVEPQPNLPLQEIIILDPDDQPMWENATIVAPTPNYAIVQPNVDDNFVINSTHLKMIWKNKFDDYLRADSHDHIPKAWFNQLNEESITSWDQMRRVFINRFFPPLLFNRLLLEIKSFSQLICEILTDAWLRPKNMLQKCHGHGLTEGAIIQIFYHGLDESTQAILDVTAEGIFLYKSANQAFQFLDDKLEALTVKMDSQFQSLKEEMHEMHKNYNNCGGDYASKNDDRPMCERHEANYIRSEDYQNRNSHNSFSHQSLHVPNDPEKSLTELNNDVKNDLEDFKRCIRSNTPSNHHHHHQLPPLSSINF